MDLDLINEAAREKSPEQPLLKLNLGLEAMEVVAWDDEWPAVKFQGAGFWTEPFHGTEPGHGRYWEFQPLGLVCNLVLLALTTFLVGWIVERKLAKHGRLFKFSLRSLLLATALVAIGMGWFVPEYAYFQKNQQQFNAIKDERLRNEECFLYPNFETRFPTVVSQLLNHGQLPFVEPEFFVALNSQKPGVLTLVWRNEKDLQGIRKLAQAIAESPFSVNVEVELYGRRSKQNLAELEKTRLTDLTIHFENTVWAEIERDSKKDSESADEMVNVSANYPHLKKLNLCLTSWFDQESQLKPFCKLDSLEEVLLCGVSTTGVEFMLKTKEQWPRQVEFEFESDVSQESKELLWQYFDPTYEFYREF